MLPRGLGLLRAGDVLDVLDLDLDLDEVGERWGAVATAGATLHLFAQILGTSSDRCGSRWGSISLEPPELDLGRVLPGRRGG